MSERYEGLCIGGPLAGRRLVRSKGEYEMAVLPLGPNPGEDLVVSPPAGERYRYVYKSIGLADKKWSFWVLDDRTLADIIDDLVARYEGLET